MADQLRTGRASLFTMTTGLTACCPSSWSSSPESTAAGHPLTPWESCLGTKGYHLSPHSWVGTLIK